MRRRGPYERFPNRTERFRRWIREQLGDGPLTDDLVESLYLAARKVCGMSISREQIRALAGEIPKRVENGKRASLIRDANQFVDRVRRSRSRRADT